MAVSQLVPAKRRTDAEMRHLLHIKVTKAFDDLGERNPLRQLDDDDRMYLWSLLLIFEMREFCSSEYLETLNLVSELAHDAMNLAERIESALRMKHEETLARYLKAFGFLPGFLKLFANRVGSLLDPFGKTANKRRRAFGGQQHLVEASEFVRLKTGTWHDEHLADLFQFVAPDHRELSGDVIHKRRERFKKEYPELYQTVVLQVQKFR